jgi:hypothetical protein
MADPKDAKDEKKKDEAKKTAEPAKPKSKANTIMILVGIVLIVLYYAAQNGPISLASFGWGEPGIDSRDVGVLRLTTSYTAINTVELDPNEGIAQYAITPDVAWELSINGIPIQRFAHGTLEAVLADSNKIGQHTNMSARVIEGQAVQTMDLAYVKYHGPRPPRGWFKAAQQYQ